jgi:hypothetical protein
MPDASLPGAEAATVVDPPIAAGYGAALAVEGSTPRVMLRDWTWASS